MFESDSICLQVLSHWTRCEKRFMAVFIHPQVPRVRDRLDSDSICCVLACSVSWFLRAFYARALDRIFWYWNLFIWRLMFKIFQSLAQMLILKLSSFIFNIQHFSGLRPTMSNFKLWSSFSAFPSPWFKHVNGAVAKLPISLMLLLFSVKHGVESSKILMLTPLWHGLFHWIRCEKGSRLCSCIPIQERVDRESIQCVFACLVLCFLRAFNARAHASIYICIYICICIYI